MNAWLKCISQVSPEFSPSSPGGDLRNYFEKYCQPLRKQFKKFTK